MKPYLDINAIHLGYGFFIRELEFATKCRESGIKFVIPTPADLSNLGDKVAHKKAEVDKEIGATLQGSLSSLVVKPSDTIKKNDLLFII